MRRYRLRQESALTEDDVYWGTLLAQREMIGTSRAGSRRSAVTHQTQA